MVSCVDAPATPDAPWAINLKHFWHARVIPKSRGLDRVGDTIRTLASLPGDVNPWFLRWRAKTKRDGT